MSDLSGRASVRPARWAEVDHARCARATTFQQLPAARARPDRHRYGAEVLHRAACAAAAHAHGQLLWDCIPFIDAATVEIVKGLGGVAAIAVSHPHYYSTMVE